MLNWRISAHNIQNFTGTNYSSNTRVMYNNVELTTIKSMHSLLAYFRLIVSHSALWMHVIPVDVHFHTILIPALDGAECLVTRPDCFLPRKELPAY
jgi:hypothetical protein